MSLQDHTCKDACPDLAGELQFLLHWNICVQVLNIILVVWSMGQAFDPQLHEAISLRDDQAAATFKVCSSH